MLTLTPAAAGKVKELLVEEGRADIALRVAVQPGGCSGLRYAMYLDDQVTDKDASEEQHGVRIVIDKLSVPYLSQATVDFIDSLEQTGFTIDNPAAQGDVGTAFLDEELLHLAGCCRCERQHRSSAMSRRGLLGRRPVYPWTRANPTRWVGFP